MRTPTRTPNELSPRWSRAKIRALLAAATLTALAMAAGLAVFAVHTAHQAGPPHAASPRPGTGATMTLTVPPADGDPSARRSPRELEDALAAKPMPRLPDDAAEPGPVSTADPGPAIDLPAPKGRGPAGVLTGFPHTPAGALAQLAAIDQAALQPASVPAAQAVIKAWAAPGGPTPDSWSGVTAVADLLNAAGLPGGGDPQLALAVTPMMGLIKGTVGQDFVIPCVDYEIDATLGSTARAGVADCQRMSWNGDRWFVGAGTEPAGPPAVWPDTDAAISAGYRNLRHG